MPICTVEFGLDTPVNWGVRMVEIGAKFFYQDGAGNPAGDYYTSKPTNILTGGRDQISNNDANKCTYQIFAVAKLSVPGQPDANLSGYDSTDAQNCLIRCPFIIRPKTMTITGIADFELLSIGQLQRILTTYRDLVGTTRNN